MEQTATETRVSTGSFPELAVTSQDQASSSAMASGGAQVLPDSQQEGSVQDQFALPHTKAIDLIGEEFVPRMKTEPEDVSNEEPNQRPSVVMSVSASQEHQPATTTDQSNLVYCNLNDLDFNTSESGVFTSLAAISSISNQSATQEGTMTMTSANSGLLQMVQAVPGLQLATNDKNPYSAVSTILLQGGILQVTFVIINI